MRARRRRVEREVARRRLLAAVILAALGHLALVPLLILSFAHRPAKVPPPAPPASFVELPAAAWDALRSGGPRVQAKADDAKPAPPKPAAPEPRPDREPPGQVVQTPPGNGEEDPDARFAAESSNRVEKESLARDRDRAPAVTTPERQVAKVEADAPKGEKSKTVAGVVDGAGKDDKPRKDGKAGSRIEIPSVDKRDQVALKADPTAPGGLAEREASEALEGNSDRLRLRLGPGDGDDPSASTGLPRGTGDKLTLFPSDEAVARITGAPFADHVEGVEAGEGTFLNTREWKYASFFNRVKRDVAGIWDPATALRRRDPTGELFAWKDRLTVVRVILDDGGRLRDVYVEQSSGVDFLDREAIRAFEEAQPFPNPPRGILDDHAQVSFSFGFFLDTTSRPGLNFFRVPR